MRFICNWRICGIIKMFNKILFFCFFRIVSLVYINIGFIYLLYLDNYIEVIWYFFEVIKFDFLYI